MDRLCDRGRGLRSKSTSSWSWIEFVDPPLMLATRRRLRHGGTMHGAGWWRRPLRRGCSSELAAMQPWPASRDDGSEEDADATTQPSTERKTIAARLDKAEVIAWVWSV